MVSMHERPQFSDFSFSDDSRLAAYRGKIQEALEKKLRGEFWIGPDIPTAQDITIPGNGGIISVPILLDRIDHALFMNHHDYAISSAAATTRSRYAQLGLEVVPEGTMDIASTIHDEATGSGESMAHALISVINWAQRPIFLAKGTKFFYLYYWNRNTLRGEALQRIMGKDLRISGKEGETWRYWYGPDATGNPQDIEGIEFFIDQESASYIPPGNEPMRLSDGPATNHNRGGVDAYLQKPLPETSQPMLWIAQTLADFSLSKNMHGIVDMNVAHGGRPIGSHNTNSFQTNSILLRGGNTKGPMRTEIWSTTGKNTRPQTSLVRFTRA